VRTAVIDRCQILAGHQTVQSKGRSRSSRFQNQSDTMRMGHRARYAENPRLLASQHKLANCILAVQTMLTAAVLTVVGATNHPATSPAFRDGFVKVLLDAALNLTYGIAFRRALYLADEPPPATAAYLMSEKLSAAAEHLYH